MENEPNTRTHETRWIIPYLATLLAMMALQMSSNGFAPLLPAIQQEFRISYSQMGLFTGMYGLMGLALSIPAGIAAKRFGEKRVLTTGLVVVALGLFLLSAAENFTVALSGRAAWLIGYRFAFICTMTAIALTCPPPLRSRSMGILGAMQALASVLGAPFGSTIARDFGWRHGILGFSIAAALGAVIFWGFYRRDPNAAMPAGRWIGKAALSGIKPRSAFKTGRVWMLAALMGMCGTGSFSATFFVPSAVKSIFNLDALSAAYIISSGFMLAIGMNLLLGYLNDHFNKWNVMSGAIAMMIPASFAMATDNLLLFRVAAAVVLAMGLATCNQVYAIAGDVLRGKETGNVMGIIGMGGGIFGYVGPQALGLLRDWTGGFSAGWYLLTGVATLATIEVLILRRSSARQPLAAHATT